MTRVLVTGASGFIGRAVVGALTREGYAVRAAVRQPPQPAFAASVDMVEHPDLALAFDWEPLLEGVDQVVHLAGVAHTRGVSSQRHDEINRLATARLGAGAARAGVRHFVFVSSIRAQSGPAAAHALSEQDVPAPTDAYGRSKLAAENAVRACGVPFTILRPVPLYGPGAKGNLALVLRAARSPLPLPLKSFVNRRSLLGIDNFTSALAFVLANAATIGETYVLADPGTPPQLVEVFAMLRRAQHRRPLMVPLPQDAVRTVLRLSRRADLWERLGGELRADPGKLIACGWQPAHDTPSGLAALVKRTRPANGKA